MTSPQVQTRPYAFMSFLALPMELRNHIYTYIFPRNTRFSTSQRMVDPNHEVPCKYTKPNSPRCHPVVIDGVKTKYLLGILGTCRQIREEATDILNRHVKGIFNIMIATEFERIPPIILALIDTAMRVRSIQSSAKYRYLLRFPNLKTAAVGTFVVSRHTVHSNLPNSNWNTDRAAYKALIKQHFNDEMLSQSTLAIDRQSLAPEPFSIAYEYVPKSWKLMSGKCPAAILAQILVVHSTAIPGANPHRGVLVTYDFNHGRVVSVQEKRFARLLDSAVSDPSQRHWRSPQAWRVLDYEEASH